MSQRKETKFVILDLLGIFGRMGFAIVLGLSLALSACTSTPTPVPQHTSTDAPEATETLVPSSTIEVTSSPGSVYLYTDSSWWTRDSYIVEWTRCVPDDDPAGWEFSMVTVNEEWDRELQGMDPEAKWILSQSADIDSYFCREFTLSDLPTSAILRISANPNYIVYVNGIYVGEDLEGNDSWIQAESYDVTPHLVLGTNSIAAEVRGYSVPGNMPGVLIASLTIWH